MFTGERKHLYDEQRPESACTGNRTGMFLQIDRRAGAERIGWRHRREIRRLRFYGAGDFEGKHIENAPSRTARVGLAYRNPKGLYGRLDVRNVGDLYFYNDVSKSFPKQKNYTVVDLNAGYRFGGWELYAYGRNLLDEKYIETFMSNFVASKVSFGDPRTFGVGVRYEF